MAVQYADNSLWQIPEWTATGEPRVVLDPNGTEVTNTFDKLGRLTARSIEPGAGVAGHGTTLAESFAYDGLSRLVRAQDADSRVERRFDSLGNLLQEVQSRLDGAGNVVGTPYTVGYGHDDRGNEWLLHYPHGRHVKRTVDDLGRIVRWDNTDAAGTANGLIAQDTHAGAAARIEKRAFANGTETRFGYDTQRRMTESLTVRTATQAQIARVTSSWDPAGNKAARQDWQGQTATPWQTFDFGRDSLYRLASVTGMQGGAALPAMDYALDAAGNRDAVTQGALTADYAFLTTDNAAVNQYGRRAIPAAQMVEDLYWDAAGNLAAVEQFTGGQMGHVENWTYNWRHQPVTFQRWAGTSGLPAAQVTYRYDALGRRIARVENGTETRFVYDGGRVIEERRGTDDSVLASYVHGAYIDDVVTMRRAVPQGGIPADWFFHSDDQFSVSAVTNAAGALAERVAYGDFGAPTFFTPGGSAMVASAIGNPYAFTGRRWDAAERTYHYRFRTFSPGLGRFTTRDPIGIWGDALNLGNGYTYTGNDPWSWVDPWGLESVDLWMEQNAYGKCKTRVLDSETALDPIFNDKRIFREVPPAYLQETKNIPASYLANTVVPTGPMAVTVSVGIGVIPGVVTPVGGVGTEFGYALSIDSKNGKNDFLLYPYRTTYTGVASDIDLNLLDVNIGVTGGGKDDFLGWSYGAGGAVETPFFLEVANGVSLGRGTNGTRSVAYRLSVAANVNTILPGEVSTYSAYTSCLSDSQGSSGHYKAADEFIYYDWVLYE